MAALRTRREQMLQALKRDQPPPRAARGALLGGTDGGMGGAAAGAARETDTTAALSNAGLLQQQQQIMTQQDQDLATLERTVVGTKVSGALLGKVVFCCYVYPSTHGPGVLSICGRM